MSAPKTIEVPGWPRPSGYSNGAVTTGKVLHVAGQIGWNPQTMKFDREDFVGQFDQALANVVSVIEAAGGTPAHLARMTIYVTDLDAYRKASATTESGNALGKVWKARLGKVFPAMALIGVAGLVERQALVEIEAVASLPD
jgi:enamine deaminase RidA (YjgF/YER057c/UK114 family)